MPLVIIVGWPGSGKTTIANKVVEYFEGIGKTCQLVSDEGILKTQERNKMFRESRLEKDMRGSLKATVQRILTPETLVVLDAGNYIKGYRYELYCLSKEHKTTHCILEIVIHKDIIFERNKSRPEEERYDEDILQKLMNRYESPDSRNRWDSPHIPVMDDSVDMDLIRAALYDRNAPPPNLSTQSQPVSGADYMTHLDNSTRQVVNHILSEQEKGCLTNIQVPGSSQPVNLSRSVSAVELNKLRRQFIAYTKSHPVNAVDQISSNFVLFIGSELQT